VERPSDFQEKAWRQWGEKADWPVLQDMIRAVPDPFDAESVESVLRGWVEDQGVKPKEVFQPLRVALTGTTVSPGIFESVAALGREETLARLDKALQKAK
jgi:glutamyl-tRNA synthetase